jgi:hypothetical protein
MSYTTKVSTSDADAATVAGTLLEAADTLTLDRSVVRTVSGGARVGFLMPTTVYTESELTGGVAADINGNPT